MFKDPIIEEIRKIRREIEEECGNDPQMYFEHIQKLQENYKHRLVNRKPKSALKLAKAG